MLHTVRNMRHASLVHLGHARSAASVFARSSFRSRGGNPAQQNRIAKLRDALPGRVSCGWRHYSTKCARSEKSAPQALPARQEIIGSLAQNRAHPPGKVAIVIADDNNCKLHKKG
jgi:hypothetical protein